MLGPTTIVLIGALLSISGAWLLDWLERWPGGWA